MATLSPDISASIALIKAQCLAIIHLATKTREIAEFNQELAEIEAQLDRELYAQKLSRIGRNAPISSDRFSKERLL